MLVDDEIKGLREFIQINEAQIALTERALEYSDDPLLKTRMKKLCDTKISLASDLLVAERLKEILGRNE